MVPVPRVELGADPYQGPVLPLYYTGLTYIIIQGIKNFYNAVKVFKWL